MKMTSIQAEKSNDDCYFYYYSTCTKGTECPYRHCESALGSEIVCTHWRDSKCSRLQCKYRHMDTSRINRSSVQCWFETQPTGCRKPHCVFMHRKPRNLDEDSKASERLILPLMAMNANANNANNEIELGVNEFAKNSQMKLIDDDTEYIDSTAQNITSAPQFIDNNVDPFSISITDCEEEEEEEESDNEIDSTQCSPERKNKLLSKSVQKCEQKIDADFGVKTLEQIRMEKIFKQNENDSPIMDNVGEAFPKPDTTANKPSIKTASNKDLRVRIKRKVDTELRITAPILSPTEGEPESGDIKNDPNMSMSSTNFGIKTLEQIRKEREETSRNSILGGNQEVFSIDDAKIERRGEKRSASTDGLNVVKIRRSGPNVVQKITNENISDNCESVSSTGVELINTVSSSSCAATNNDINSNNNVNNKQRLKSLDADLDEYDFLDGDSNVIDTNNIDDDEDDELMREINQVINS